MNGWNCSSARLRHCSMANVFCPFSNTFVHNATWCLSNYSGTEKNQIYSYFPEFGPLWSTSLQLSVLPVLTLYVLIASFITYFRPSVLFKVSLMFFIFCSLTRWQHAEGEVNYEEICKNSYSDFPLSTCRFWFFLFLSPIMYIAFIFMLLLSPFAMFWWCEKLNLVKDTTTGFDYLRDTALSRGKTVEEFAKEILRKREPGNLPPAFPNGWIPLVETRNLQIGKAIPVSVLGRQFAVFRGADRKAHVLDAFCPHLGANLAVGGRVLGSCIECPFHGWKFDGNSGKCVHIPYAERVPEVARSYSWTCCEENGFIYVWHHAEGCPPSWTMVNIPEIKEGTWIYRGRSEHVVHCHIQEIPENGADVAHLNQIHTEIVFSGNKVGQFLWKWAFLKHIWQPNWEPCTEPENLHIAKMSLMQHVCIFNIKIPFTKLQMDIHQIGPASVHMHMKSFWGNGVFVQNIIPEGPLQQRIIHQLYSGRRIAQWFANRILSTEATMVERDIMIWNSKKFLKNPVLVKEDKLIRRYRRWYSQFYSENSPTLQSLKERRNLEW